jgi:hypothetical protein
MSMEELLESLIKKTQSECEESLRQYIAALNGNTVVVFCLFCQAIFIATAMRFRVLTVVSIKATDFWDVAPCILVNGGLIPVL